MGEIRTLPSIHCVPLDELFRELILIVLCPQQFRQAPGDGRGLGSLAGYSHRVAKNRTQPEQLMSQMDSPPSRHYSDVLLFYTHCISNSCLVIPAHKNTAAAGPSFLAVLSSPHPPFLPVPLLQAYVICLKSKFPKHQERQRSEGHNSAPP